MDWRVGWIASLNAVLPALLSPAPSRAVEEVSGAPARVLRAGVAAVDVAPPRLPVLVNGYFNERQATKVFDRPMARSIVLDDGRTTVALCVVDNLMLSRSLIDQAKELAAGRTGIAPERMLVSATHTHSAPSAMGALGSRADTGYQEFLIPRIAESIALAFESRVPARIGWTVARDAEHSHCRRWIFRPDRMIADPFGQLNVRANMHPGHQSPNHIGPSGPADPDLTLLSLQAEDGKPLGVLANYAMHYYGAEPISADFCGRFGERLAARMGIGEIASFIGIMSQGTSGDAMWMDYSRPEPPRDLDAYTDAVATIAASALAEVEYHDWVPLAMAETKLELSRRVPDPERLRWAKGVLAGLGGKEPQTMPEIYAREQLYLHDEPKVELKLQALRVGDFGIVAIPNEVFAITGIKLKLQSPLEPTMVIELANGAEGYIPPPEQHKLGGYTTWAARTAGLEVKAEPKIALAALTLLEKVSGRSRRPFQDPISPYARAVLASKPVAFWRLGEIAGQGAADAVGMFAGRYEDGVALYLDGPPGSGLDTPPRRNRAAHFAGGRVEATSPVLSDHYSFEFWFWNGLPNDARPVTGYLLSRGEPGTTDSPGEHLGIEGTHDPEHSGKLILLGGNAAGELLVGQTVLSPREWNHVVIIREGAEVRVYLNGNTHPEISGQLSKVPVGERTRIYLGGRCDSFANFEGKLDEVALFDRVLRRDEVIAHYHAAGRASSAPSARTKRSVE